MSGLAELLMRRGYIVSGSDRDEGYALKALRAQGATISVGHAAPNVEGADIIIYTAAIAKDNPELMAAGAAKIPMLTRATLLGQLMQGYEQAIGVCGAHGKTTTSAMLAQTLLGANLDPTVHIGGRFDAIGGSTRIGGDALFVAEACEFQASFLQMRPTIAVVLNIDADHLDYYRDIEHIQQTFETFVALLPVSGYVVGNGDDPRVRALMDTAHCRLVSFGLGAHNDWYADNLHYDQEGRPIFTLMYLGKPIIREMTLQVHGQFSVYNALAALATAHVLGADMGLAAEALSAFVPVHRRFELTGIIDGVKLYHDYGHNPVEMRNAIGVAKMQNPNRLWAVMQPHTYSRVKSLFEDYITCCDDADEILITDIYAAREVDPGDINTGMLIDAMASTGRTAHWTPTFDDTETYLRAHWQPGDLVLTMGCGNINLLNDQILENGDTH